MLWWYNTSFCCQLGVILTNMLNFSSLSQIPGLVCFALLWFALVCLGLLWSALICLCLPWSAFVCLCLFQITIEWFWMLEPIISGLYCGKIFLWTIGGTLNILIVITEFVEDEVSTSDEKKAPPRMERLQKEHCKFEIWTLLCNYLASSDNS